MVSPKLISVPTEQLLGENVLQTETKEDNRINVVSCTACGYTGHNYQSMMLVESAAEKPSVLKLISVAVQSARPAMTGKRDRFTHRPGGGRGGAKNLATTDTKTIKLVLFQLDQ